MLTRCAGLLKGMGAGESVELLASFGDAREVRKRRDVDAEEPGAGGLAREADIGHRYLVAMAEAARFLGAEVDFERGQRPRVPMPAPCHPGRLVDLKFVPRYSRTRGTISG